MWEMIGCKDTNLEHTDQLLLGYTYPVLVFTVYYIYDSVCVGIVAAPVRPV